MTSVTDDMLATYKIRREMSRAPDLATALLARVPHPPEAQRSAALRSLIVAMEAGTFQNVTGNHKQEFVRWLFTYLTINKTAKGATFYPVHPALCLPNNGENIRIEPFLDALAACFTPDDVTQLYDSLWSSDHMPPFEQSIHALLGWQLGTDAPVHLSKPRLFSDHDDTDAHSAADSVLNQAKRDILALATAAGGIQSFIIHVGRYLAYTLARYLLASANVDLRLPIYAAPAADAHDGVRTLAHEIVEIHRSQLGDALTHQFRTSVEQQVAAYGGEPADEQAAQRLARQLFVGRGQIIARNGFEQQRAMYGSFADITLHYYWTHGAAFNRFLRQLHSAHLNLAKKAGLANSRSQNSRWHFYWLAPAMVDTLLLLTQQRVAAHRILISDLLADWRTHYGIAIMIDQSWDDVYRDHFRSLGSPEALNDANVRRFSQILADRGRLHKNSDDFPWVILKD